MPVIVCLASSVLFNLMSTAITCSPWTIFHGFPWGRTDKRGHRARFAFVWLLMGALTLGGGLADAATYRYKNNAPPARMLLDMMEIMGVVERVPDGSFGYGGSWPVMPWWGLSPWSTAVGGGGFYPWLAGSAPAGFSPWQGSSGWIGRSPLSASPGAGHASNGALWSASGIEQMLAPNSWSSSLGGGRLPQSLPYRRFPPTVALEGLWSDSEGRMLLLSSGRFAWQDAGGKLNAGIYRFENNVLTTFVPGYDLRVRYAVSVRGDRLTAVSESGLRYNFYRMH